MGQCSKLFAILKAAWRAILKTHCVRNTTSAGVSEQSNAPFLENITICTDFNKLDTVEEFMIT